MSKLRHLFDRLDCLFYCCFEMKLCDTFDNGLWSLSLVPFTFLPFHCKSRAASIFYPQPERCILFSRILDIPLDLTLSLTDSLLSHSLTLYPPLSLSLSHTHIHKQIVISILFPETRNGFFIFLFIVVVAQFFLFSKRALIL